MTIIEIINNVLAGGMLGALGQGIRVAVGLKKFNEENAANAAQGKPIEEFSTGRLVISIFVGFVAGAIGMLVKGATLSDKGNFSTEAIVTIIAIGYSGADFIEGVFNTYINKFNNTAANAPAGSNPANTALNEQPTVVPDEANFSNTPAQG
jgi:hypothetical protein